MFYKVTGTEGMTRVAALNREFGDDLNDIIMVSKTYADVVVFGVRCEIEFFEEDGTVRTTKIYTEMDAV